MNLRKMRKHAELCRATRVTIRVTESTLEGFWRQGVSDDEAKRWIDSRVPPLRGGPHEWLIQEDYATGDKLVHVRPRRS